MGLPSGTLWLDRPLGAASIGDGGLMYQWGALHGYYTVEQFPFTEEAYRQLGLDSISTDLTVALDAAAVYYGDDNVRIPTADQMRELMEHSNITHSGSVYTLQSQINGNIIKIRAKGLFIDQAVQNPSYAVIWSRSYVGSFYAMRLQIETSLQYHVEARSRWSGALILPVKA